MCTLPKQRLFFLLLSATLIACGVSEEPPAGVGSACTIASDCGADGYCGSEGVCLQTCAAQSDCADDGCCLPIDEARARGVCAEAAECSAACGSNARPSDDLERCECRAGYVYNASGECIEPQPPGALCEAQNQCMSGRCLGDGDGFRWCTSACVTDVDCAPLTEVDRIYQACCRRLEDGSDACLVNNYCVF